VKTIRFISKADALKTEEKQNPQMTKNLAENPLPNEYEVIPKNGSQVDAIARQVNVDGKVIEKLCPPAPGGPGSKTATGESCNRITHRVLSVARYLWIVVLIAFIVLLVSSTLLIANTIRLSIFARRREIEVMKLVGATNWFVRGPFMIEGLLAGGAGALLAIFVLVLCKQIALPAINYHGFSDAPDVHAWSFPLTALVLLGMGLTLGAVGSGLTLRRFLKV
jgi:cell division transport system permease protein